MKRSLLALAVLGAFAGVASAQSSVTVYGIIDVGVTKANNGTSFIANPGQGKRDQWNLQNGQGSRLGFMGKEDLGGGSYARFDLQHRVNIDSGTQSSSVFWNGRSVVAVGGTWGEIYAGREYSPAYAIAVAGDPTNGIGYVSRFDLYYMWANHTSSNNATDGDKSRHSNTVGYKSTNMSGLTFEASVAGGEGTRAKRVIGANVQYNAGPIYLGGAYDGTGSDDRMWLFTAAYDFGVIRPTLSYSASKGGNSTASAAGNTIGAGATSARTFDTANTVTGQGIYNAKALALTASMPVGPGRLFFGGARLDPNGGDNNSTKVVAGYEYMLSKRTLIYGTVGSAKQDGYSTFIAAGNPGNQRYTRSTAGDLGIQHKF